MTRSILARVLERVIPEPNSGCWFWMGTVLPSGYGITTRGAGTRIYTHRVVYEEMVGPIPAGMQIDHKCRVTCCCNPAHLEPVTPKENLRRAVPYNKKNGHWNAAKTHCPQGHPYEGKNLIERKGRQCRTCGNIASSRYHINRRRMRKLMEALL